VTFDFVGAAVIRCCLTPHLWKLLKKYTAHCITESCRDPLQGRRRRRRRRRTETKTSGAAQMLSALASSNTHSEKRPETTKQQQRLVGLQMSFVLHDHFIRRCVAFRVIFESEQPFIILGNLTSAADASSRGEM